MHDGVLYLLEQTSGSLVTFDLDTGRYRGKLLDGLPDSPETMLLLPGKC